MTFAFGGVLLDEDEDEEEEVELEELELELEELEVELEEDVEVLLLLRLLLLRRCFFDLPLKERLWYFIFEGVELPAHVGVSSSLLLELEELEDFDVNLFFLSPASGGRTYTCACTR